MDLTERDLLVATLMATPVEERSRLYACVAENDLPLPLAFSGMRCPCPPEDLADEFTSQGGGFPNVSLELMFHLSSILHSLPRCTKTIYKDL